MTKYTASTILNYSPRKTRLIINTIKYKRLDIAMVLLKNNRRPKSKKIFDLLKSAASNLKLSEQDYPNYQVANIVAEQAFTLYRIMPRAKGAAHRIRRRYSRIKVLLQPRQGALQTTQTA